MTLCSDVLKALQGKTLSTAESCTGGGIGAALTAVPGSSAVYKGGIISYCNELKMQLLNVPTQVLEKYGAVSAEVAVCMAQGVSKMLCTDVAVSVTGLAGPDGDDFGNPVGTVFIGYCDSFRSFSRRYYFHGDRESVRQQAIISALNIVLEQNTL